MSKEKDVITDEQIEKEMKKIKKAYSELSDSELNEIRNEFKRMQQKRSVSDIAAARWCIKATLSQKYQCSKGRHCFEWRQTVYDGKTGEPKEVLQCRYCGKKLIK